MNPTKQKIVIRPPKMSDLDSLLSMINSLVEEKAMITIQKKLARREEKEYLEKIIKDKESIHLFLIIDGKVMGNARISIAHKHHGGHIAEMGISIKKEARGLGLGKKLFKETVNAGIKKFKFKIITLEVLSNNKIAKGLYKKMGFEKIGLLKNGAIHYGKYNDIIMMAKYL